MLAAASSDGNLSVHTCNVDTGEWSVALVQNEGNLPAHPLGATMRSICACAGGRGADIEPNATSASICVVHIVAASSQVITLHAVGCWRVRTLGLLQALRLRRN